VCTCQFIIVQLVSQSVGIARKKFEYHFNLMTVRVSAAVKWFLTAVNMHILYLEAVVLLLWEGLPRPTRKEFAHQPNQSAAGRKQLSNQLQQCPNCASRTRSPHCGACVYRFNISFIRQRHFPLRTPINTYCTIYQSVLLSTKHIYCCVCHLFFEKALALGFCLCATHSGNYMLTTLSAQH
jgi:hypothetical protein